MRNSTLFVALGFLALSSVNAATPMSALRQGTLSCIDHNAKTVKMKIVRHPTKPHKVVINWAGRDRILHNRHSVSGALRYEGAISKLVYLQMPSHSVLLDNNTMRPILTECKL